MSNQAELYNFAGLYGKVAHIKPVGSAVGFPADEQGQRQQHQGNRHQEQYRHAPGANQPHNPYAYNHGGNAHAVIHGLVIGVFRLRGVQHQHAQGAEKIGQGKQQPVRGEKPGQQVGTNPNHGRYRQGQGESLPGIILAGNEQKCAEIKQHNGAGKQFSRVLFISCHGASFLQKVCGDPGRRHRRRSPLPPARSPLRSPPGSTKGVLPG